MTTSNQTAEQSRLAAELVGTIAALIVCGACLWFGFISHLI